MQIAAVADIRRSRLSIYSLTVADVRDPGGMSQAIAVLVGAVFGF